MNFLRARSRKYRWKEEKVLLPSEMNCTSLYFSHKAGLWQSRAEDSEGGKKAYACRQITQWQALEQYAKARVEHSHR